MATLHVDTRQFHFDPNVAAEKYDEWVHYQEFQRRNQGKRAVDVVAVEMGLHPHESWMIELKDYRNMQGEPKDFTPSEIVEDFRRKVVDTREGLADAAARAADDRERSHASCVLSALRCIAVLHLEPYTGHASRLFPRDPSANVRQKLKQLFGPKNPPLVLNMQTTLKAGVPWRES